jgi:hypothetical protein
MTKSWDFERQSVKILKNITTHFGISVSFWFLKALKCFGRDVGSTSQEKGKLVGRVSKIFLQHSSLKYQ